MNYQSFYSHGKLLLTGEYLVTQGACALAVPLVKGQSLTIKPYEQEELCLWQANEQDSNWFQCLFNPKTLEIIKTDDAEKAKQLIKALNFILDFNLKFENELVGKQITTNLEFQQKWGFGSSSTFINNLATWSNTDPYVLQDYLFKGSGYDIACASSNQALFYQIMFGNKVIEHTDISDLLKDHLFFVYLGKKQNSQESLSHFLRNSSYEQKKSDRISEISRAFSIAENINEINHLIAEHEQIMSGILNKESIKDQLFSDFPGQAKSLGAWGGDFALLSTHLDKSEVKRYLKTKNLNTLFTYKELVLDQN